MATGVKLTASLEWFLFKYHPEIYNRISFGHTELYTPEIQAEYEKWVLESPEAKDYLKGGKFYHEPR